MPVSGPEFFPCSRDYPVMFVETATGGFLPVALLAITARSHQMGNKWKGVYVPAFIKRYPFALAEGRDVIMIDEEASHFNGDDGESLFDDSGEPTDVLQEQIQYLDRLDQVHRLTLDYTHALKVKGMLRRSEATVQLTDSEVKLDSFFVVDEKELYESLTHEEIVDWHLKGWLAWTYAHIHSTGSVTEILKRMAKAISGN